MLSKKSFRHALHLVTAYHQNQVAHTLRTRDFWLASLSIYFPIHFALRAHEYPVTLIKDQGEVTPIDPIVTAVGQRSMVKVAQSTVKAQTLCGLLHSVIIVGHENRVARHIDLMVLS